jgi:putative hydrolase
MLHRIIDLHMHSLHSDGELLPAELVRRAEVAGYTALAITDHVDQSNLHQVVSHMTTLAHALSRPNRILVFAGVEITHVPPLLIPDLIIEARAQGAEWIVVHGETPVEPVEPGTNRAAIQGKADVLAHPGLISIEDVRAAKKAGVILELTARAGHNLANGHVARLAQEVGCPLIVNSDTHAPHNLLSPAMIRTVVLGAGLSNDHLTRCQRFSQAAVTRIHQKRKKESATHGPTTG